MKIDSNLIINHDNSLVSLGRPPIFLVDTNLADYIKKDTAYSIYKNLFSKMMDSSPLALKFIQMLPKSILELKLLSYTMIYSYLTEY